MDSRSLHKAISVGLLIHWAESTPRQSCPPTRDTSDDFQLAEETVPADWLQGFAASFKVDRLELSFSSQHHR